ncbi:MAG: acetate kinase [Kiritimatiellae bacterium]|nr:acetate kinase [Kiritimatiellia bacterium]
MRVLVLNCGSSSVKYQLFDMPNGVILAKGLVQRIGDVQSEASQKAGNKETILSEKIVNHKQALRVIKKMLTDPEKGAISNMSEIGACGHRVVHGGEAFSGSVKITTELEKVIESFSDLAPLHNPPNLTGIQEAGKMLGDIPQVACFDTAFHHTIPDIAYFYALPYDLYKKFKIRRYGFHGTSHRYVARRAACLMDKNKYDIDVITCHLGNGSSIAAVKEGRSVDTSMGFTPLEGVVMGTRTGDLDPAIIFYLNRKGYSSEKLDTLFNKESGLLGISGTSNDMRDLEERADSGDTKAQLALDIFAYRIRKYIGSYLAVLNGCDAIVFTGGIGENDYRMRAAILENMENLGVVLDHGKNESLKDEGEIQADDSRIMVFIIPTDEEGAIAKDTYLLASGQDI